MRVCGGRSGFPLFLIPGVPVHSSTEALSQNWLLVPAAGVLGLALWLTAGWWLPATGWAAAEAAEAEPHEDHARPPAEASRSGFQSRPAARSACGPRR